jgi:hypothetical protein
MGLLETVLEAGRQAGRQFGTLEANEQDTTAHNPTEMPDQENIALKNPYTRDRLAPYAQRLSSPYIIRNDSSLHIQIAERASVAALRVLTL